MKIGTYKLLYGGWYPPTVRQYVHKRVESLGKTIGNKLGTNYEVRVFNSKHSEATYLRIRLIAEDVKITIGFRNHGNLAASKYDHQILLSKYETWLDCKRDFIANRLPDILEELNTVKWSEKQITNTLVYELTRAFREAGASE